MMFMLVSGSPHPCDNLLRKQIWMPKTHGKKGGPKIEEAQLLLGSLCGQPRPNPSCAQASPQTSNAPVIRETRPSSPSQVSQLFCSPPDPGPVFPSQRALLQPVWPFAITRDTPEPALLPVKPTLQEWFGRERMLIEIAQDRRRCGCRSSHILSCPGV